MLLVPVRVYFAASTSLYRNGNNCGELKTEEIAIERVERVKRRQEVNGAFNDCFRLLASFFFFFPSSLFLIFPFEKGTVCTLYLRRKSSVGPDRIEVRITKVLDRGGC